MIKYDGQTENVYSISAYSSKLNIELVSIPGTVELHLRGQPLGRTLLVNGHLLVCFHWNTYLFMGTHLQGQSKYL